MPLLTDNNKKNPSCTSGYDQSFWTEFVQCFFCSSVLSASIPCLSHKARSLAVLFLCYIFIIWDKKSWMSDIMETNVTCVWAGEKKPSTALNPCSYSFIKLFEMIGGFFFSSLLRQAASLPGVKFSSHLRNCISQDSWGWDCCRYDMFRFCGKGWRLHRSGVAPRG